MKKALVVLACWCISVSVSSAQTSGHGSTVPPRFSPAERLSISAEALVWWMKDSPAPPPLVSTGVVGRPGTPVLVSGEELNTQAHPGLRVTAGYWVTERWGLGDFRKKSYRYLMTPEMSTQSSDKSREGARLAMRLWAPCSRPSLTPS